MAVEGQQIRFEEDPPSYTSCQPHSARTPAQSHCTRPSRQKRCQNQRRRRSQTEVRGERGVSARRFESVWRGGTHLCGLLPGHVVCTEHLLFLHDHRVAIVVHTQARRPPVLRGRGTSRRPDAHHNLKKGEGGQSQTHASDQSQQRVLPLCRPCAPPRYQTRLAHGSRLARGRPTRPKLLRTWTGMTL